MKVAYDQRCRGRHHVDARPPGSSTIDSTDSTPKAVEAFVNPVRLGGSPFGRLQRDELERAGAYRVYADPADLLMHIDEVGGRR